MRSLFSVAPRKRLGSPLNLGVDLSLSTAASLIPAQQLHEHNLPPDDKDLRKIGTTASIGKRAHSRPFPHSGSGKMGVLINTVLDYIRDLKSHCRGLPGGIESIGFMFRESWLTALPSPELAVFLNLQHRVLGCPIAKSRQKIPEAGLT